MKRKELWAGVVLATAVALGGAGGATYAQWQKSVPLQGGVITNGDFKLAGLPGSWKNTTTPTSTYVAGETVQLTQPVDVVLTGDNLQASFRVAFQNAASPATYPPGVQATWTLLAKDGTVAVPSTPVGTAGTFRAVPTASTATLDGQGDYTVKVDVKFTTGYDGTSLVGQHVFSMKQVR